MTHDRLGRLRQQKEQLEARIAQIEARKKSKERKDQARRLRILGEIMLEWVGSDGEIEGRAANAVRVRDMSKSDKALFDGWNWK